MKIYFRPRFLRQLKKLGDDLIELSEEKTFLFEKKPFDPQLKTHKLHGKMSGFWSFSLNSRYRIIFEFVEADEVWFHAVGDHDLYE